MPSLVRVTSFLMLAAVAVFAAPPDALTGFLRLTDRSEEMAFYSHVGEHEHHEDPYAIADDAVFLDRIDLTLGLLDCYAGRFPALWQEASFEIATPLRQYYVETLRVGLQSSINRLQTLGTGSSELAIRSVSLAGRIPGALQNFEAEAAYHPASVEPQPVSTPPGFGGSVTYRVKGETIDIREDSIVFHRQEVPQSLVKSINDGFSEVSALPAGISDDAPKTVRDSVLASGKLLSAPPEVVSSWLATGVRYEDVAGLVNLGTSLYDDSAINSDTRQVLSTYLKDQAKARLFGSRDTLAEARGNFLEKTQQGFETPQERALQPYLYDTYLKADVPVSLQTNDPTIDATQKYRFLETSDSKLVFEPVDLVANVKRVELDPQSLRSVQFGNGEG